MDLTKILENEKFKALLEKVLATKVTDAFYGHRGRPLEVGGSIPRNALRYDLGKVLEYRSGTGVMYAKIRSEIGFSISRKATRFKFSQEHKCLKDENKHWEDGTIVVVKGWGKFKGEQVFKYDRRNGALIGDYADQGTIKVSDLIEQNKSIKVFIPRKDAKGNADYSPIKFNQASGNGRFIPNEIAPMSGKRYKKAISQQKNSAGVARKAKELEEWSRNNDYSSKQIEAMSAFNKTPDMFKNLDMKIMNGLQRNKFGEVAGHTEYYDTNNQKTNYKKLMAKTSGDTEKKAIELHQQLSNAIAKSRLPSDTVFKRNMDIDDFLKMFGGLNNGITRSMSEKEITTIANKRYKGLEAVNLGMTGFSIKAHKPKKGQNIEMQIVAHKGDHCAKVGADTFAFNHGTTMEFKGFIKKKGKLIARFEMTSA